MSLLKRALLVAMLGLASMSFSVSASTITLDFKDISGIMVAANYERDGFRLSPNCHFDILSPQAIGTPYPSGNILNFDFTACDTVFNPDFLGPTEYQQSGIYHSPAVLWLDRSGAEFNLESLFVAIPHWTVTSSNGGYFEATTFGSRAVFSGPEWTAIDWLLFVNDGSTDFMAFADPVFGVPEPGSVALIAIGLVGLVFTRRRALRV